ncbi:lipoate--protein ligase family protein [bacterium]|nr:lipoate--protein ligase family protein [bacterium]
MSAALERWRFIDSNSDSGSTHMAVDLALAQQAAQRPFAATLRVYRWQPAAVSLGYHQSLNEIDVDACRRDGVDVVYRPTGGRAVLHSNELTYSVTLSPASRLFTLEIMGVYEQISLAILAGLAQLQIPAVFDRSERTAKDFARGELSSLCYASAVQHEIGVQGRKLVGSAQRRFADAILQHGSILIGPEHCDLAYYLARGDQARRQTIHRYLAGHTVCLNDLAALPVRYKDLAAALQSGFQQALNIEWIMEPLSPEEQAAAERNRSQAESEMQRRLAAVTAHQSRERR